MFHPDRLIIMHEILNSYLTASNTHLAVKFGEEGTNIVRPVAHYIEEAVDNIDTVGDRLNLATADWELFAWESQLCDYPKEMHALML